MHIPLTPLRCLLRALDLYPNKIGVVSGDGRYTYAEFVERCRRIAAGLLAEGVQPGDRVGFLSFNSNVLLESYFAVPLAGGVVMPLNVRLHRSELEVILKHSQPRLVFYEQDFSPTIELLRTAIPACRFIPIDEDLDDRPSLVTLMALEPVPLPNLMSLDETSIAELFYTSGSTGRPKGVMLSHRSLYLHALALAGCLDHSDNQVILHTIPLFHANGWGFPHFATMCGFKHVMVRRFDPLAVFGLMEEEQASFTILVPTMAATLVACPERTKFDLSSLKHIIIGGAAASPELVAQLEALFPGCAIMGGYGLTETSPVVSIARQKSAMTFPDDERRRQFAASAGWPSLGVEVRIIDNAGTDVPQDSTSVGEIVVRGDNIMDGYFLEPDLTQDAIVDGWLRTGDMAVWNEERCVKVVDRKKDVIISGGENIASIELEHAIQAHPDVVECAVVAAPDPRWGEVPVAIVVTRNNSTITEEQLLEWAGKQVAKFKLPKQFVLQKEPLPKGGTGKILKYQLREQFWNGKEKRIQG
ncbi:long-chain-fatty-acid--CoA ligase [Tunturibacter empetritectus]|uniref:Long-chain-fatty-acid--CoA ligase n=1 Tax=Tunturiibacter empetritectus TaxID=3069691 RepID=A0AAU7ZHV8_9BACT